MANSVALDIAKLWAPSNLRRAAPGIDRGGVLGLDILEQAGVAGAAVAAHSARIGDGRSTLQDGTLSAVNQPAYRLGLRVGSPALALARAVADKE